MSRRKRTLGALLALASLSAFPVMAADDTRFSVAVGTHDDLLILGSQGQTVADVASQTVGRKITVGGNTFQLSYGRDATGQLTAILTPPNLNSVSLHFSAGGKSIDADKAVVTLTFAPNLSSVLVDPGYVGTVVVDSHLLRAHSLADDLPVTAPVSLPAPPSDVVAPVQAPDTAVSAVATTSDESSAPVPASNSAPAPEVSTAPVATTAPADTTSTDSVSAAPSPTPAPVASDVTSPTLAPSTPPMMASQLTPILPPVPQSASSASSIPRYQGIGDPMASIANAAPQGGPAAPSAPGEMKTTKLYWSEPITAPDGTAPQVASNEIRLVEVHGDVSVIAPGGTAQAGVDGMVVESGSTVRTSEDSSAALFMGGVNSARMMPKCELVVTQNLAASVRTNVINLQAGAVFSRVGHRDGETEIYTVSTAEGNSDSGVTDFMTFRGTPAELHGFSTARTGLGLDPKQLLAWNPDPTRGLISDVPTTDLGILTPIGNIPATYFYYAAGARLTFNAAQIRTEVLTNLVPNATTTSQSEPDFVLQAVLTTLQPYNLKLNQLLKAINAGTETPAQLTYYHSLITVFFNQQAPGVVNALLNRPAGFTRQLNVDSAMLWQDLNEFKIGSLTPH